MDRLTAALHIAKVVALRGQRANVDLDCFEIALQFLNPSPFDALAEAAGVRAVALARIESLPGGDVIAAEYRSEPQLRLSDALAKMKDVLAKTEWAKQAPEYHSQHTEALSKSVDIDHLIAKAWRNKEPVIVEGAFINANLQDRLATHLLGQECASSILSEELAMGTWQFARRPTPQILVLAGPPACGKSTMIEILARECPDRQLLTLNMASYQNEREGFGLIGLRFGWSEARPGRLTKFVWDHPDAIVVFDHIDLAHSAVQQLLMPLLVSGSLDDEFGFGSGAEQGHPAARTVDFSSAILIFTTTAGAAVFEQSGYGASLYKNPADAIAQLRAAIAAHTPDSGSASPARPSGFLSQLSENVILPFRSLALPALQQIVQRQLRLLSEGLMARGVRSHGLLDEELALALTLAKGPEINARELDSAARDIMRLFLRDCTDHGGPPQCLDVLVAPSETLAQLRKQHADGLQNQLLRRSERLSFTLAAVRQDGTLNITLDHCRLETVRVTSDYGTAGGFEMELPSRGFDSVAGHERVKARLAQVVKLLQAPAMINGAPVALPKGMLLYGAPGTGKTMLARALAAEARLPFISVTGPQLLDLGLMKSLFQRARKFSPSVIFIDEIDALGTRSERGADLCINQLLTEIDGFRDSGASRVFVIAATNFPDRVDGALTRSGRLDLHVEIPMLDREARAVFIERFRALPHQETWDEAVLIDLSAGMSGADLEKVFRECQLELIRTSSSQVTMADLLEQINVVRYGERVVDPPIRDQLTATAFHEAGHAIVSMILCPEIKVQQVTIAARRDTLGLTSFDMDSAKLNMNEGRAINRMCVMLGGRMAEAKRFPEGAAGGGGSDAGAASDLHNATRLAWTAITEWGLDESFGWISMSGLPTDSAGAWHQRGLERTSSWIALARAKTATVIDTHWDKIERLADHLLVHEMIDGQTLRSMFE
ncbi:MAG: AAA family ATPase [Pseudomonadota bacterium]